jgi:NAD(P)H dehydrogenase (quinone)
LNCLVVIAHPLAESLCATLAAHVIGTLRAAGHQVVVEDLYANHFSAVLTAAERRSYYTAQYDCAAVESEVKRLVAAEAIVLLFPTWWFGFPAILKGWFDRAWAPGIAYDHSSDYGPIKPRLPHLRKMLAVTTLGAPWWIDRFVMRRPVRKVLKTAILQTCAPRCSFKILSLYKSERLTTAQVQGFLRHLTQCLDSF